MDTPVFFPSHFVLDVWKEIVVWTDCHIQWLNVLILFYFSYMYQEEFSCGIYTFCVDFSILVAQICSDYMLFYFLVPVAFICTSFKTFIFGRALAVLQKLIISPWLSINLYTFQRVRMTQNLTQLKSWCHFLETTECHFWISIFSYILCQFISQMKCMTISTHK